MVGARGGVRNRFLEELTSELTLKRSQVVEDVGRTFQAEGPAKARAQVWTKPRA